MKKPSRQCQAVTIPSTYSASHQCLKRSGVHKVGPLFLCAHHRAAATRAEG
jgi:hypothetical protein